MSRFVGVTVGATSSGDAFNLTARKIINALAHDGFHSMIETQAKWAETDLRRLGFLKD